MSGYYILKYYCKYVDRCFVNSMGYCGFVMPESIVVLGLLYYI